MYTLELSLPSIQALQLLSCFQDPILNTDTLVMTRRWNFCSDGFPFWREDTDICECSLRDDVSNILFF